MKVLLTGATGFIGRRVAEPLRAAGHEVHEASRATGADLLESAAIVEEVRPDVLVHMAWYAEHGKFWTSTENLRWVEASLRLLRAFAENGGRRAVLAGTCAEYDWTTGADTLREDESVLNPATLYGAAKNGLHQIAAAYAQQEGFELAWGRVFFLYGPDEAPGRLVASVARSLLNGEPAQTTEGTQVRDFLHVEDVGAAFAALAQADGVTGAVNIASGEPVRLSDVIDLIASETGHEELLERGALPQRPGEPERIVADVHRLTHEVGFTPRHTLRSGIASTVAAMRDA